VTCVVRNDRRHAWPKRAMLCPLSQMKTPSALPALPPILAQRTVSELLAIDHRTIDALLADTQALLNERDFEDAGRVFASFCGLLRSHIEAEEALLFASLERLGGAAGPINVMRCEHAAIQRTMPMISLALQLKSGQEASRLLESLLDSLSSHNQKEERVLYPMVDAILERASELENMVSSIEALLRSRRS